MNARTWWLFGALAALAFVVTTRREAVRGAATRTIAATAQAGTAVSAALKKVEAMILSDTGLKKIQFHEQFRNRAYKDIAGKWTIAWGHLILPEEMTKYVGTQIVLDGKPRGSIVITQAEGDALKRKDLRVAEDAINRMVKVPLTQPMYDALVSLVYNIGSGNFAKSSVLSLLNAGRLQDAAKAFLLYNKARDPKTGALAYSDGLNTRRLSEKQLFESGLPA